MKFKLEIPKEYLEKIKDKFSGKSVEEPENYNFGKALEKNHRFCSMKGGEF